MNQVTDFVRRRSSTNQHVLLPWTFVALALVLMVFAGCAPVQRPVAAAPAAASAAAPVTLQFAVSDADQRPSAPYVNEFIDQVKILSHGSISIEPIWDAGSNTADGFERGVIQEVRKGIFPLGLAASRTWDTQGLPNFQALQAPFLITNDALAEAVAAGNIGTRMLASLPVTDVVGLTMWPEDLRHPFSVMPDKPLLAPEDFKGLTIRSGPSNVTDMMIKTLGATPLSGDSGYQGAESGLRQGYTLSGKPTATANVTFYPKFQILFANGAAFAQLTEDQRTILRQAAAAVQEKAIAEHPRDVDAGIAWCDDGGTIALASDAQVAAFEQVEQPVFDMIAQDPVNAQVIAAIRDLKANTIPSPMAAACAPIAAQPKLASGADTEVWSEGLPPNGVWQVTLTADELVQMGMLRSEAADWAGVSTITFQDGKQIGHWVGEQGQTGQCAATYEVVENFVRITRTPITTQCPREVDDIQWRLDNDGLHLHLVAIQGAKFLESKASLEAKPWQKVEPTTTSPSGSFEGLSSGLDNAKQARIRTTSALPDGPNVDVFVNGLPASNGGKLQQGIPSSEFSGWLYLPPGDYSVALVPHGGTIEEALFAPVTVKAEAGHRYTVAAMGEMKDNSVKPLVVDETALEAGIADKPTSDIYIGINNLKGIGGLATWHDGKLIGEVSYGGAAAMVCPHDERQFEEITVAGAPDTVIASADMWCHLGVSSAAVWYGDYPDNVIGGSDSQGTSETTNVLDFLAAFNSHAITDDNGQLLTFNTLLSAVDKAGMRAQFASTDPYYFLAPTDTAFAQLPKEQLDALLNDPQALTELLKTHFVRGYYPAGSLSGSMYGQAKAEVTNLLGQKLRLLGSSINGLQVAGHSFTVGNGNRVQLIDKVLSVQ